MIVCPRCEALCDARTCPFCGRVMDDEPVRDEHAAELVPHAWWGDAWITPWLAWPGLEHWRQMHRDNDG